MALESTLTLTTQVGGLIALTGLPTTTSVNDDNGVLYISKSGVFTTITTTTSTLALEPITSNAETVEGYATVQEVNKAELYLESLSDDELASLCETTNLLIETKDNETVKTIKKV